MKQTFTTGNITLLIRKAADADAQAIIAFARDLFSSSDQVLTVPDEFNPTLEQERDFIRVHSRPDALILVALDGEKVVGLLNFLPANSFKMRHTGEFGLSVHPAYQRMGIGRKMLQVLLGWATLQPDIEKVLLRVFHTNEPALKLYESCGFVKEGRQVRAIKQKDGSYADLIHMAWTVDRS
jgi:RimJ/RimL family protein N-acetyltransferase